MSHPNLGRLKGLTLDPVGYIQERSTFGILKDFVKQGEGISWPLLLKIGWDIANGMDALHCLVPPLWHGSLNANNIMVKNIQSLIFDNF